jgi:hypothetical protein
VIARVAAMPSVTGIRMSITTTSACASAASRTASVGARYWEQLSEAEAEAAALGCSVSAVKAATGRGLRALQTALAPDMECTPELSTEEAGL